jgi:hypothetical protein
MLIQTNAQHESAVPKTRTSLTSYEASQARLSFTQRTPYTAQQVSSAGNPIDEAATAKEEAYITCCRTQNNTYAFRDCSWVKITRYIRGSEGDLPQPGSRPYLLLYYRQTSSTPPYMGFLQMRYNALRVASRNGLQSHRDRI